MRSYARGPNVGEVMGSWRVILVCMMLGMAVSPAWGDGGGVP